MSTDRPAASARTRALRQLLVATVDVSPAPRHRRRTVALLAAALVVAGAVAGGTVSAAFAGSADPATATRLSAYLRGALQGGARFLGTPAFSSAEGSTTLSLGAAPKGATDILVAFQCRAVGHYTLTVTGSSPRELDCGDDQLTTFSTANPEGKIFMPPKGVATVTMKPRTHGAFDVWATWAAVTKAPPHSVQQRAEIADGVVTRQEYLDAFSRYQGCMAEAGYPSQQLLDSTTVFGTGSADGSTIASDRCYARELEDVDALWQAENQQQWAQGYDPAVMRYCLTSRGITPASTPNAMLTQLNDADINPVDCSPVPKDR